MLESRAVKLTLQTQLLPDGDQVKKLSATMQAFNTAADWLAGEAFRLKTAGHPLYRSGLRSLWPRQIHSPALQEIRQLPLRPALDVFQRCLPSLRADHRSPD